MDPPDLKLVYNIIYDIITITSLKHLTKFDHICALTSYFPFVSLQIALRGNFLRFLSALLLALRTLGGSFSGLVIPLAWNSAISKDPEFLIGNAFLACN